MCQNTVTNTTKKGNAYRTDDLQTPGVETATFSPRQSALPFAQLWVYQCAYQKPATEVTRSARDGASKSSEMRTLQCRRLIRIDTTNLHSSRILVNSPSLQSNLKKSGELDSLHEPSQLHHRQRSELVGLVQIPQSCLQVRRLFFALSRLHILTSASLKFRN